MNKLSKGRIVFQIINYTVLTLLACVCLFPLINILAMSFSSASAVAGGNVSIWPVDFNLNAYEYVLRKAEFWDSLLVSVKRVLIGVPFTMLITILTAYPLSKERSQLRARSVYAWIFFFTMLFSGGLIPTFLVVKSLGLIDTFWVMILPTAVSTWNLIMMKTFFQATPVSLLEAARIDGSSELGTLVRIVLPLSIPSIMTIGLFYAVSHWNDYFQAMIYLNTPENFPLQIHLRDIVLQNSMEQQFASMQQGQRQGTEGVKYATIMFATLPILCVYPFIQKYFVKGVMLGSIKE